MAQPALVDVDPLTSAKIAHLRYVTGDGPGIKRKRRAHGFSYIGPDSKPVRDAETLERIRSLVIPPAWEQVWICPFENGHIQAIGRDARGRKQYRYHPRYRAARDETKFERMVAFGEALPRIRAHVNRNLSLPGLPQRKVVAAVVRLLDETSIRIGNEEYVKQNKSFGLTTLRRKHAEVRGGTIHLHFLGKSHQEHDIMLRDPKLAKIVKRCQDLPGQELFEYESEAGEPVKIDSGDVNDYLREVTREHFTAKDFRTWHGTGHVAKALAALGPPRTEREAKLNIVDAIKETAEFLGNRPAAARKYYIHPAVLESYADRTIVSAMGASVSGNTRTFERCLMRLVGQYAKRVAKHRKIAS